MPATKRTADAGPRSRAAAGAQGFAGLPIRRPPYRTLAHLLARELHIAEDPGTLALIRTLRSARRRGALGRDEFLAMCRWKSPRATRHYALNSAAEVRRALAAALRARRERSRIEALMALRGVSVPVASAILTLLDPRRYGVLDIRVWQLLYAMNAVGWRPSGRGFTPADWEHYLLALRRQATRLDVPVRAVEYSLFRCHRRLQHGRLYDAVVASAREGRQATR
jgi:hypothetical protein